MRLLTLFIVFPILSSLFSCGLSRIEGSNQSKSDEVIDIPVGKSEKGQLVRTATIFPKKETIKALSETIKGNPGIKKNCLLLRLEGIQFSSDVILSFSSYLVKPGGLQDKPEILIDNFNLGHGPREGESLSILLGLKNVWQYLSEELIESISKEGIEIRLYATPFLRDQKITDIDMDVLVEKMMIINDCK